VLPGSRRSPGVHNAVMAMMVGRGVWTLSTQTITLHAFISFGTMKSSSVITIALVSGTVALPLEPRSPYQSDALAT
jgi:hypothetical protein